MKAPGYERLTLICDDVLPSLAFKFNLRRYKWGDVHVDEGDDECAQRDQRRGLTLVHVKSST